LSERARTSKAKPKPPESPPKSFAKAGDSNPRGSRAAGPDRVGERHAFRAMIPLLSFGLGCLVTAGVFLQTHSALGPTGYPIWALLFVNGAIATTGGTLVGLLGKEARDPEALVDATDVVTVPRAEWDQIQAQLILGQSAAKAAALPVPSAAPPILPLTAGPEANTPISSEKTIDELLRELEVITRPATSPTPGAEPESTAAAPVPTKSPARHPPIATDDTPFWAESTPLTPIVVRAPRPASPWTEDGLPVSAAAAQSVNCETCHRPLPRSGPTVACSICGEPMCADCSLRSKEAGHPGQCDHCVKLVNDLDRDE
jgi:hypothetical protein